MTKHESQWLPTTPRKSATFDDYTLSEIRRAAATGIYDIRGGGTKRRVPNFDDLLMLGASMSRYPLEGYREKCGTEVTLGTRFAKKPIKLCDPDHDRRHELSARCPPTPMRPWAAARHLPAPRRRRATAA